MRKTLLCIALVTALGLSSWLLRVTSDGGGREPATRPVAASAAVVDALSGSRVVHARVVVLDEAGDPGGTAVETGPDGIADVELDRPRLVRVTGASYVPRVLAIAPGISLTVPLTPRTAATVSLRFGGDVMRGRRFYQDNADAPALLRAGSSVADHARLLSRIAPMLADADLTVVNLETPLVAHPFFTGPRPKRFHPDKELVFASAPETAGALAASGVDVVDLANNHLYDALEPGVRSTISAVDRAGLAHFGAGPSLAAAWRPAYVDVRGQTVAFVGCTTVDGARHAISYVAGRQKAAPRGGEPECCAARSPRPPGAPMRWSSCSTAAWSTAGPRPARSSTTAASQRVLARRLSWTGTPTWWVVSRWSGMFPSYRAWAT